MQSKNSQGQLGLAYRSLSISSKILEITNSLLTLIRKE